MNGKYTFSFTAGSTMISETRIIAEEYNQYENWNQTRQAVLENNLLNKVKNETLKRQFTEIKKRLSLLNRAQLQILVGGMIDDAKAIILLSLAKSYNLVADFINEVIRIKFFSIDYELTETDYDRFINHKMLSHPELTRLTETTSRKVKQVIFRILEETGLIIKTKNWSIVKPILSDDVLRAIVDDDPSLLTFFLVEYEEQKILAQKHKHARTS